MPFAPPSPDTLVEEPRFSPPPPDSFVPDEKPLTQSQRDVLEAQGNMGESGLYNIQGEAARAGVASDLPTDALVPSSVFKAAAKPFIQASLPRVLAPIVDTPLGEGMIEQGAENLSGMTSLDAAAKLPAYAIPVVGQALAGYQGAEAIGTGAGEAYEGLKQGDVKAVGKGLANVGMGATMVVPAVHGARGLVKPKVPPKLPVSERVVAEPVPLEKPPVIEPEIPTESVKTEVKPETLPSEITTAEWEKRGVKYARRSDGTLKTKGEYTPDEWKAYTDSAIDAKQAELEKSETSPVETKVQEAAIEENTPEQMAERAEAGLELAEPQGAIANPGPPLAPTTIPPITKTPKSQRQIITDLAKGLSLPIRFGRLRTSKFGGYFLKVQDLIGSKKANDIPIVSHEVGHKLDSEFSISSDPALRAELDHLGDPGVPGSRSSWTPSKTRKYKLGEGMAEFTRLWLTDPPKAQTMAPNLHTHFESILNANKDFGDVMRQARDDIQTWRTAEPQARLRSHISVGGNPNKTRYTVSQLTRDLVDDLHFMRLAVDDAEALAKAEKLPSQNPYLLARNLRGSYGMADTFIRSGVADFKTKAVQLGTSLEHALKPIAGRMNDFRDWIVAKQAREMHRQGKETGLVPTDVDIVANRFDSDQAFQEAFTKVKAWNDSLLKYAVDSGLVTPEGAAAMRAMNTDYVPFHRVFEVGAGEPSALEGTGTGRGLNVGKPGSFKGRHGSSRDIVDPIETMVKNAYSVITASEKAAINRAVADLSTSPGMGKWVEHVAAPKEQIKVGLEKIRQELGANGADLTGVPDDLLLSFFQNGKQAPYGENIIRIVKDGKPEFYRLKKELFEAFHALDLDDSGKLIQILSSPTQLLRAGVTLAPDFALANAMRDTFSASIISKYNAFPFEVTLRGVAALLRDPKLVSEWAASGGKSAIEANYFDRTKLQNFLREKITKELTPAEQALVYAKSPLVALRQLSSFAEEATRIGEYQKAFNSLVKSGMPEGEARRMAAFEARDRQDFAKGGAKTKIVRHLAAFWNAQLQANVKLVQAFRDRPVKTMLAGLAFITIPKLLEQALNWDDKDYWDRPQWERDLMFLIPIGKGADGHTKFIRIPTPFEPGIIFGTLPGRLLQWAKKNDPEALKSLPKLLLGQSVPNPIPQTLMTVFSDFLSGKKGWDVWRGRTVVPESLAQLPPEMQWTEQTSLTARKLGKLLDYSPMKIEHIINSTTGGLGKQLTHQVSDRAISAFTGEKRTASSVMPGGRFVTTPAAVASESIDQFYKTLDDLRTDTQGKKHGGKLELNHRFDKMFSDAESQMADWRKRARETKNEAQRAQYQELILKKARSVMEKYNAIPK